MAEQKSDDHPQPPSLSAMAWFAVFLAVALLTIMLVLQMKFGHPAAG